MSICSPFSLGRFRMMSSSKAAPVSYQLFLLPCPPGSSPYDRDGSKYTAPSRLSIGTFIQHSMGSMRPMP